MQCINPYPRVNLVYTGALSLPMTCTCISESALDVLCKENEELKKRVEELIDIHYYTKGDILLPKSKRALKEEIKRARAKLRQ
jgi:hypothetical protein